MAEANFELGVKGDGSGDCASGRHGQLGDVLSAARVKAIIAAVDPVAAVD